MIIETIVTTVNKANQLNFAPMGVSFEGEYLVLRPFRDTTTYQNLITTGVGVVNITDNVLIFTLSALTKVCFPHFPAQCVKCGVLIEACNYYEFSVEEVEEHGDRPLVSCRILNFGKIRDLIGFNRGKNAVIEAVILATRVHLLPAGFILKKLKEYREIVDKTAGLAEKKAMDYIQKYVQRIVENSQPIIK